jgi:hypothetical protein
MAISSVLGSSALLPAGLGFRNVLINADFRINQRGYASAANLASGAYGFDRWKSSFTNTTLTFTSAPQGQQVTINSGGSIKQIVERANVSAGTYILSWTGTATGRVYNTGATAPSYAASPIVVTLDGLANVEVEFTASGGTQTLWKPQLEQNRQPTPFEQRPIGIELALCQRYYEKSYVITTALGTVTQDNAIMSRYGSYTGIHYANGSFQQVKRAVPTFRPYATASGAVDYITVFGYGDTIYGANIGTHKIQCSVGTVAGTGVGFHYTADAEL